MLRILRAGDPGRLIVLAVIIESGHLRHPLIRHRVEQLADPGKMIIPVGDQYQQELKLLEKIDGEIHVKTVEQVRFVNLIGTHGWPN